MQKMTMTTALLSLMYGTFLQGIIIFIVNKKRGYTMEEVY